MRQPDFYSAVYAVIKNEKNEILFGRRENSGFMDGFFQLPAGHIEGKESIKEAVIREIKEEVNLDINKNDINIIHICHRIAGDRIYFDIYAEINKYTGELKINEADKCSELKFFDINNLPNDKFVMYDINCIKKANSGDSFSEII